MNRPHLVATLLLLASPGLAAAQDRLAAGDAAGVIAWLNAARPADDLSNNRHNGLMAEGSAGWYWTDHLKTEIAAGASTRMIGFGSTEFLINGQRLIAPTHVEFTVRRIGLTQQYQFGRNEWFHPTLGAGVDLVWQRSQREDLEGIAFDPVTRISRLVRPNTSYRPETDLMARAAVTGGFKAYLTRRAFFRADLRITFTDRAEDALLRGGFGFDWGGSR